MLPVASGAPHELTAPALSLPGSLALQKRFSGRRGAARSAVRVAPPRCAVKGVARTPASRTSDLDLCVVGGEDAGFSCCTARERQGTVNNVNPANRATRYVHPTTSRSVVLDKVTAEVIHVGGDGLVY